MDVMNYVHDNMNSINDYIDSRGKIAAIKELRLMFDSDGKRIVCRDGFVNATAPGNKSPFALSLLLAKMLVDWAQMEKKRWRAS